jgi:hypothetical protein
MDRSQRIRSKSALLSNKPSLAEWSIVAEALTIGMWQ